MSNTLSYPELADLIQARAGVSITPADLEQPGAHFDDFGVDSLGLLGVVGELENRHGLKVTTGAESAKTPAEFLQLVNSSLSAKAGA
ncbi:acyl carrier protein [Streptomyces rubellomurinus]|uniref:Curamycin polyketide synthase acyl carrier protein n=2 Tax=Streptomyces TaxID=1883 RepID=A0A0F2THD7_STRR3|nr:acyl carrier protein [Streptomyces rubellomurinus]KJS57000.1 Curamycin polyketide synthase acyl carrier protein [Streptomyces rubellomurinus subsp. indigoferus]KJS62648.1 Curamycin polyketide synthase acyl carrier protein [Streptomyces rubellomurinus]